MRLQCAFSMLVDAAIADDGSLGGKRKEDHRFDLTDKPQADLAAVERGPLDFLLAQGSTPRKSLADSLGPVSVESGTWSISLAMAVLFGQYGKLLPRLEPVDGSDSHAVPVRGGGAG